MSFNAIHFPKIRHLSSLTIPVLQKCQRSSTALKIKNMLLKLPFKTHSKFTVCPPPTLQTRLPLSLYYVDNRFTHCLTLPYAVCLQTFVFFHLLDEHSLCSPLRVQSPHLYLPYLLPQGHLVYRTR